MLNLALVDFKAQNHNQSLTLIGYLWIINERCSGKKKMNQGGRVLLNKDILSPILKHIAEKLYELNERSSVAYWLISLASNHRLSPLYGLDLHKGPAQC